MYLFKQIYFQVQSFFRWTKIFLFWTQKIKENFMGFYFILPEFYKLSNYVFKK